MTKRAIRIAIVSINRRRHKSHILYNWESVENVAPASFSAFFAFSSCAEVTLGSIKYQTRAALITKISEVSLAHI